MMRPLEAEETWHDETVTAYTSRGRAGATPQGAGATRGKHTWARRARCFLPSPGRWRRGRLRRATAAHAL